MSVEEIRQIVKVPADRRITVQVPDRIAIGQSAEVIILVGNPALEVSGKYGEMAAAATDPLLMADIREAGVEYRHSDHESW